MSWLESHQSLRDHPKKDRLAELLYEGSVPADVADNAAIGLLHRLWWWALDYAPRGDLSGFSARQIAKGCCWSGDPGLLLEALKEAGFVERESGTLHDWDDYGGRLAEKREADAERKRRVRRTSGGRPADVPRDGAGTYIPNLQNLPDQPGSDLPREEEESPCPVRSADLATLGVADEWREASGTRGLKASQALLELGRRTCEECRRLAMPATCETIVDTCSEVYVSRLRQAIRASPRSMAAYLASITGVPGERLIERLTAAKRAAQRVGATSGRLGGNLEGLSCLQGMAP